MFPSRRIWVGYICIIQRQASVRKHFYEEAVNEFIDSQPAPQPQLIAQLNLFAFEVLYVYVFVKCKGHSRSTCATAPHQTEIKRVAPDSHQVRKVCNNHNIHNICNVHNVHNIHNIHNIYNICNNSISTISTTSSISTIFGVLNLCWSG